VRLLEVRRVYPVVLGHRPVSAEINRIRFARQVSHAKRARNSFEVNFRNISNIRHLSSKPEFLFSLRKQYRLYAVMRNNSIRRPGCFLAARLDRVNEEVHKKNNGRCSNADKAES
jgi:hypothetical protein